MYNLVFCPYLGSLAFTNLAIKAQSKKTNIAGSKFLFNFRSNEHPLGQIGRVYLEHLCLAHSCLPNVPQKSLHYSVRISISKNSCPSYHSIIYLLICMYVFIIYIIVAIIHHHHKMFKILLTRDCV